MERGGADDWKVMKEQKQTGWDYQISGLTGGKRCG